MDVSPTLSWIEVTRKYYVVSGRSLLTQDWMERYQYIRS